jgi:CRP-like cAMP-binding protein
MACRLEEPEPMSKTDAPKQDHLIAALPPTVYRRLVPRLQPVTLPLGKTLLPSHSSLRHVYFPTTSVVSLSYGVEQGATAMAWPVGNEGIVGISAFLGGTAIGHQAEVQFAGEAFQLDAQTLKAEFQRAAELQKLLLRYVEALIAQASQLIVCGQHHTTDQRLCRWLLRTFDRVPTNELPITQQRIGRLLGVRRESITEAAFRLQGAGAIHYSRGVISLLNRRKLEARTCVCYAAIKGAFMNLRP